MARFFSTWARHEPGMAMGMGWPVIVLRAEGDTPPFDRGARRLLLYDANDIKALEVSLEQALRSILSAPS